MANWKRNDKVAATVEGVLPAGLGPGGQIIREMEVSGRLAEVARRVVVNRRPGFAFVDAFMFLVAYFAQGKALWGLRGFYELHREWGGLFASLGGREQMISSTSLSRLLSAAEATRLGPSLRWLLLHGSESLPLLQEAAVQTRDARGDGWHVFDFDPSRQAYRQRALAEGADLPPGERRLRHLAAPGYAGRKRGEVVSTESMLQHAGSGLWLGVTVEQGNGDARRHFEAAVNAVTETCEALAVPPARALLRTDGAFGGVPSLVVAHRAGIAYVSRSAHYEFLDRPNVRERLDRARWERVPDSGSGPVRHVAELGTMDVCPERGHTSADEGETAPFRVRLVVTRCVATGGAGRQLGDEKFELFESLGLEEEAWPAASVVELYYGRIGQENRFAQLDAELSGDTTWSETLGGQQLALACAMFVWNKRIVAGTRLAPPLPPPPPQEPRPSAEAPHFPLVGAPSADAPDEPDTPVASACSVSPAVGSPAVGDARNVPAPAEAARGPSLDRALAEVAVRVGRRKGYKWEEESRTVVTEHGLRLPLFSIESVKLRFATDSRSRQFTLNVPADTARAFLAERTAVAPPSAPPQIRSGTLHFAPDRADLPAVASATAWPTFLPAAARQLADKRLRTVELDVRLRLPAITADPGHPLIDERPRLARHRRWTHERRVALNAMRPGAVLQVAILARTDRPRRTNVANTP